MEMGPTCSLGQAYLLGFLKPYFFNVSLKSLSFFFIASKALSNLETGKNF
jgi:hypothetical protein